MRRLASSLFAHVRRALKYNEEFNADSTAPLNIGAVDLMITALFYAISTKLANGEQVRIPRFGVFSVKLTKRRIQKVFDGETYTKNTIQSKIVFQPARTLTSMCSIKLAEEELWINTATGQPLKR